MATTQIKNIIKLILNKYNLIPFLLTPIIIWGYDLIIHLLLQPIVNSKLWLIVITLTMPICGYLTMLQIYKYLWKCSNQILPIEFLGVIGFLYAQPTYMIFLKMTYEGINFISVEVMKQIIFLTAIVPFSSVIISTYDGTLLRRFMNWYQPWLKWRGPADF